MIIAHRGYGKFALENTISAFDKAILVGAKGIECDIRLTGDEKAIIYHSAHIKINDKKIKISQCSINELQDICRHLGHELLVLDDLFDYIKQKQAEFFLDVKTSSSILIESITRKIKENNLWDQVNIAGWSFLVRNALKAQSKHPKLQVGQFLHLPPAYRYMSKPKKSYCVFLGWLDGLPGSQRLFRALISPNRLVRLKVFLENHGFNVKAGVINSDSGLELFAQAGITDIVTDRIAETVNYFKKKN